MSAKIEIEISRTVSARAGVPAKLKGRGASLGEAVATLLDDQPMLRPLLAESNGKLYSHVGLFLNGHRVLLPRDADLPLSGADVLSIVPAVAGG